MPNYFIIILISKSVISFELTATQYGYNVPFYIIFDLRLYNTYSWGSRGKWPNEQTSQQKAPLTCYRRRKWQQKCVKCSVPNEWCTNGSLNDRN